MVNPLSIAFLILSWLTSTLLPISVIIYLYKKQKISIKAVLVGALAFLVTQTFTRLPLLTYLSAKMWFIELSYNKWLYALALSLTAGLFEETGRFLGFKFLLKDKLQWKNGVAFGLGHGGIEAVTITGMALLTPIINSIMINMGTFDGYAGKIVGQATLEAIKNSLMNTSSLWFLMPGIERVLAITAHTAMSLVVLYGVKNRKNIYWLYAVLIHTLLDLPIGLTSNTLLIEIYLVLFSAACLVFILKSKNMTGFQAQNTETV